MSAGSSPAPSLKSDSTGQGALMRAVESAWHMRTDTSGLVGSANKDYCASCGVRVVQGQPREMRISCASVGDHFAQGLPLHTRGMTLSGELRTARDEDLALRTHIIVRVVELA